MVAFNKHPLIKRYIVKLQRDIIIVLIVFITDHRPVKTKTTCRGRECQHQTVFCIILCACSHLLLYVRRDIVSVIGILPIQIIHYKVPRLRNAGQHDRGPDKVVVIRQKEIQLRGATQVLGYTSPLWA